MQRQRMALGEKKRISAPMGRERTTMNTEITLLKWPGEEDWMFAKN